MSVKFEIADWRFEITLKELICQPIGDEKKKKRVRQKEQLPNLLDRPVYFDTRQADRLPNLLKGESQ